MPPFFWKKNELTKTDIYGKTKEIFYGIKSYKLCNMYLNIIENKQYIQNYGNYVLKIRQLSINNKYINV